MVRDLTTTARPRRATPWYLELDPQRRLIRGKAYRLVKRSLDILFCLMLAPMALPLLLLVSSARWIFYSA
jgi:hypothetical protein